MPSLRLPSRLERFRPYSPWAALAALCVVFELPTMMRPDRLDPTAIRPTGEIALVLTAYAACRIFGAPRVLYRLLLVVTVVLALVRLDWAIYFLITRSEPLLYDQLFMARHLFVLIRDLWSFGTALVILTFTVAVVLVVRATALLLRAIEPLFARERRKRLAIVFACGWLAIGTGTIASANAPADEPTVHWLTRDVARNLRESRSIYADVERGIRNSPYRGYEGIPLRRTPNISIFFVESYGRVIAESDDLRPGWSQRLHQMESRLSGAGWHMASAYSTAPVSGGRSWLAVTSVLTGTRVEYESVFRHMVERMPEIPSLVKFLAAHGYHTIALDPSDRVRPGVEDVNYHGFAKMLRFDDIEYRGPKAGWGLVPDQYSLGFAESHVLGSDTAPRLFQFHMVTSHMPWRGVPQYVADWHSLNDAKGEPIDSLYDDELVSRLARYGRARHRWALVPGLGDDYRARYLNSIEYDLRVIEEHLAGLRGDEIVIVMGDHQPPVITPEKSSFDVPVHVFARDASLLDEFLDKGFRPGLEIGRAEPPALEHGGLFSLIVRALARCCGDRGTAPEYLRNGVPMGA